MISFVSKCKMNSKRENDFYVSGDQAAMLIKKHICSSFEVNICTSKSGKKVNIPMHALLLDLSEFKSAKWGPRDVYANP